MKIRHSLTALAASALLTVPTHAFLVDLGGQAVDGSSIQSIVFDNTDGNAVVDIRFGFFYTASQDLNAFGSDLLVGITHLPTGTEGYIGSTFTSCFASGVDCDFDLNWNLAPGDYSALGVFSLDMDIEDGSGMWQFDFISIFDNPSVPGEEGIFGDGSFIEVRQATSPIPLPPAALLFGFALGALGLTRRR